MNVYGRFKPISAVPLEPGGVDQPAAVRVGEGAV